MPPRLKVFVTSDGLTDFVVATSSKAKALAAWGVRQDVFKEGQARETDDPDLVADATAHPGEVLRRPAAGRAELAKLKPAKPRPAAPKLVKPARAAKPVEAAKSEPRPEPAPPKLKARSKAQLKLVADLEARLAALEAAQAKAQARLERDRAELQRRAEALEDEHAQQSKQLQAALSAARRALE